MSTETPKPASTPTISFRVERAIEEQIQQIAKSNGQSKSDWVRDQVMRSLHGLTPSAPEPKEPDNAEDTARVIKAIEARIEAWQTNLRGEIQAVKNAIREVAKSHHQDLCTLGQLGLDAQDAIEERVEAACAESLDAIERLKQSQRSHKDSLLREITRDAGGNK
jgi:DnaJ-domain-containing protein 1